MAENQAGNFEGATKAMEETTVRMAEDLGRLVGAWAEAGTELLVGGTRVASSLVMGLTGNLGCDAVNKAVRDTADVMTRSTDRFTGAYESSGDSPAKEAAKAKK